MNDALKYSSQVATVIKAVAIVTIVAVAGIIPMMDNGPEIEFEEFDIKPYDTYVFYYVKVADYSEDMDLTITIHNYFTSRTNEFDGDYASGEFMELKPNMEYKVTIKDGSRTVAEKTIRTLKDVPPTIYISDIITDTESNNNIFSFYVNDIQGIDMSVPHTFNAVLDYVDPTGSYGPYSHSSTFTGLGEVTINVSAHEYNPGYGYLTIDCDGEIVLLDEFYLGEVRIVQG